MFLRFIGLFRPVTLISGVKYPDSSTTKEDAVRLPNGA